jgi:hypothetical protein
MESLPGGNRGFVITGCCKFRVARQQPTEVVIAARRFHVEQQWLVADAHLSAKDRFDACLFGRFHKLDGSMQVAGVRQGDRRQAMPFASSTMAVGDRVESRNE